MYEEEGRAAAVPAVPPASPGGSSSATSVRSGCGASSLDFRTHFLLPPAEAPYINVDASVELVDGVWGRSDGGYLIDRPRRQVSAPNSVSGDFSTSMETLLTENVIPPSWACRSALPA